MTGLRKSENESAYFDQLHRKARILQSLIAVVFEHVTNRPDDHPDYVSSNLIDAARELSRELTIMTIEDPAHWEERP